MSIRLYDSDHAEWLKLAVIQTKDADLHEISNYLEKVLMDDKSEVIAHLKSVISNLRKWQLRPKNRTKRQASDLLKRRNGISICLSDSPSLKRLITDYINQHGIEYSVEQILDYDFLPKGISNDETII